MSAEDRPRPKIGRPPKPKEKKARHVKVTFDPEDLKIVRETAERRQMYFSQFVARVLVRACKELRKDPTPVVFQAGIDLDQLFKTLADDARDARVPCRPVPGRVAVNRRHKGDERRE